MDWRTRTAGQGRGQEYVKVCLDYFDAILPWSVGAYGNIEGADQFAGGTIAGDMKLVRARGKNYIPVVFPGLSAHNSSDGKLGYESIPRKGGEFLWRQVYNAKKHGACTIFGAMWDG